MPSLPANLARAVLLPVLSLWLSIHPGTVLCGETSGVRPLLNGEAQPLAGILPANTLFLDDALSIEQFLTSIDRHPPNWIEIYGSDVRGHDERLFALNRQRDDRRPKNIDRLVTFVWSGELSAYDTHAGGFRVAVGPKVMPTQWGLVRFKPEGLPSNLMAVPSASHRTRLRERVAGGERIEIDVAMTGRLVPDESIIYDFAHEEPGVGMVMPVVQIERLDYVLER